jgi:hypothetical protein
MMFTKAAIVILGLVALSCTATDDRVSVVGLTTSPYQETFAAAGEIAAEKDRSILIDFYTDW